MNQSFIQGSGYEGRGGYEALVGTHWRIFHRRTRIFFGLLSLSL